MMKRIIWVLMLIVISFGVFAAEQKITVEMLVGEWKCSLIDFKQQFYTNGKLDSINNYSDVDESMKTITHTFKKENGLLIEYYYLPSVKHTFRNDLSNCSDLSHCVDIEYYKNTAWIAVSTYRGYVSNDEFKMNFLEISRHFKTGELSSEYRTESICTRIK